jgi:hypothetical protein
MVKIVIAHRKLFINHNGLLAYNGLMLVKHLTIVVGTGKISFDKFFSLKITSPLNIMIAFAYRTVGSKIAAISK